MRKVKAFIKAFADTFVELAQKVDKGTANGDEAMAFGCLYVIITFAILFIFIIAVATGRVIWSLL